MKTMSMALGEYETLWFLNAPTDHRPIFGQCFARQTLKFPSIHLNAHVLTQRISASIKPLVLIWQPENASPETLIELGKVAPLARIGLSPIETQTTEGKTTAGYYVSPYDPVTRSGPLMLLCEQRLEAMEARPDLIADGTRLLETWRSHLFGLAVEGTADLTAALPFAQAPAGAARLLVVGHPSGSTCRQSLDRLVEQVHAQRAVGPDAHIAVVTNTPVTMAALAAVCPKLEALADEVVYGPWRPDFAADADLVISASPTVCIDAYLRGHTIRPLTPQPFGLPPLTSADRAPAVMAALADALVIIDGGSNQRVTLAQAIKQFDARILSLPAPADYKLFDITRGIPKIEMLRRSDDDSGAVTLLRKVLHERPEDADLWRRLGDVLTAAEDYADAIDAYDHAIALDPGLAEAHSKRALTRMRRGEMTPDVGEGFRAAFRASGGNDYATIERYFDYEWERAPVNEALLKAYQQVAERFKADHPRGGTPGGTFLSRLAAMQFEAGMLGAAKRTLKDAVARHEQPGSFLRMMAAIGPEVGLKPPSATKRRTLEHVTNNQTMFTDLLDAADGDIAIVGNGPQELGRGRGAEIDAHRMVVRFNTYTTVFPQSHDYGVKTDLWVRMPATGYVKSDETNTCPNIMLTGVNRLNRASSLWEWVDSLATTGHQVSFVPKGPFYELIAKLGKIPTAGLALAYMLYRETGPVDPARFYGCSFSEAPAKGTAAYHHTDVSASMGSRHDFDVEHAFFQTIAKTEDRSYYLPGLRRQAKRDIPTLSIPIPPPDGENLWALQGQTGRYDRILSVTAGLEGYEIFGLPVEVMPRNESHALLNLPLGTAATDPKIFPCYAAKSAPRHRTLVLGFGLGPTGQLGQRVAAHQGMPYMSVEYGLISSCHLPSEKQFNFSLMLDDLGAFFDTEHRSRLEAILDRGFGTQTNALTARARAFRETILAHDITKYNNAPSMVLPPRNPARRRILVIDQTSGDLSIKYGQCETYSFQDMLDHALAQENAEVFLKPHPETLAGAKGANFDIAALRRRGGLTILEENCNIMSLMSQVDEVYVMVSGVGLEALMAGKTVRCFGVPFYAGRGLTIDMVQPARPRRPLTIDELVAGVFLQYHQFYDPDTRQPVAPEICLERLIPKLPRDRGLVHDGTRARALNLADPVEAEAFQALRSGHDPLDVEVARSVVTPGDTVADISDGSGFVALGLAELGVYRVHAVSEDGETLKALRALDSEVIKPTRKLRRSYPPTQNEGAAFEAADRLDWLLQGERLALLRIAPAKRVVDVLETASGLLEGPHVPGAVLCRLAPRELKRATALLDPVYGPPVRVEAQDQGGFATQPVETVSVPVSDRTEAPQLYLWRRALD